MYLCKNELFEIELFLTIKMYLVLNNLQWLVYHKTKPNQTLSLSLSLSLSYTLQVLENAEWFSWEFEHLVSLGQSSFMFGSFGPHLPHVEHPLLFSLWCPYFLNLKQLKGNRIYFSTFFEKRTNFNFFENYVFTKCQNLFTHLYFFTTSCNGYPFKVCAPLVF